MRRAGRLLTVVAGSCLIAAGYSGSPVAAQVALPGAHAYVDAAGNLYYSGLYAWANVVAATRVDHVTVDIDDVHLVTAGSNCWYPMPADNTYVRCTVAQIPDLKIEPGDGDDTVTISGPRCDWLVWLGAGNDTVDATSAECVSPIVGDTGNDLVLSGPGPVYFDGGPGTDTVSYAQRGAPVVVDLGAGQGGATFDEDGYASVEDVIGTRWDDVLIGSASGNTLDGGAGNDELSGLGGSDTLIGGTGTDELYGGTGTDAASYVGHRTGVTADLDGLPDDGAPGENDLIAGDVEALVGSSHADTLSGNSAANILLGDGCPPYSLCLGGADLIYGGGGDDWVLAGGGADTVYGGSDDDTIAGGTGDDTLYGGSGADSLDGDAGTDTCDVGTGGGTITDCEIVPFGLAQL